MSNPEGLALARQRIAEEKQARTGFLDLGRLGLTELPDELFELEDLQGLNLGRSWMDQEDGWREAASDLAPNRLDRSLGRLGRFKGLHRLYLTDLAVSDLSPLAALTSLQTLDCSDTQVSDLSPLAALTSLQTLDCSATLPK